MTSLDTMRRHLRGVIAFPVTPFQQNLDLDVAALRHNVEWLINRGIQTLVAAGGTGELYSLTVEETEAVHRTTIEAAAGRAAVICGVGGKLREAAALAQTAERAGAAGILILPAAYGPAAEAGMLAYYSGLARSVSIGVLPYARDWAVFSPDLVAQLAEVPNVVAYKDGSADLRLWARIRARVGDRLVWVGGVGDDMVHTYFAAGAEGFTSSVANFMPHVSLELFEAARGGDFARARRIFEEKVQDFYSLRAKKRGYEVSSVKTAMELCGLPAGPVRPPLVELEPDERAMVARLVERLGLLGRS
ncbi:MAG: dihydrodipicolinate synthase family protein [Chloroflexi bacterium]|nr:dihydrodipicolinate synthase family protein [Chloroflexota bacterium]